jgi:hypothetical protein
MGYPCVELLAVVGTAAWAAKNAQAVRQEYSPHRIPLCGVGLGRLSGGTDIEATFLTFLLY